MRNVEALLRHEFRAGLPLLPVRDMVVFPYMVVPLPVGRGASVRAVESAFNADRQLVLLTQRQGAVEEPEPDDLYRVGTVASILRMLTLVCWTASLPWTLPLASSDVVPDTNTNGPLRMART